MTRRFALVSAVALALSAPLAAQPPRSAPQDDEALNRLVRDLALGRVPLVDHVDPQRGVLFVRYTEASPRGDPEVHDRRQLCGLELRRREGELRAVLADLRSLSMNPTEASWVPPCADGSCHTAAVGEYALGYDAIFTRSADGRPRLDTVVVYSEALLPERWITARDRFVANARAEARRRPCPAP